MSTLCFYSFHYSHTPFAGAWHQRAKVEFGVALTQADVASARSRVQHPDLRSFIFDPDTVGNVTVSDNTLAVDISLPLVGCPAADTIEALTA